MWESRQPSLKAVTPKRADASAQPDQGSSRDPDAAHRCAAAYSKALAAAGGPKAVGARDAAEAAFLKQMPYLTDREHIRDFIACVAQGMLLKVFWRNDGQRLIAAARAALSALPREPRDGRAQNSSAATPGH